MRTCAGMRVILVAIGVAMGSSAFAELEIREFEDAWLVEDEESPVIGFSEERDSGSGNSQVWIDSLYDPYGDPYLAGTKSPRGAGAIEWGTEQCRLGERMLGPYLGDTFSKTFERWSHSEVTEEFAAMDLQRAWLDPSSGQAFVLETAHVTVYPEEFHRRSIDISVRLVNVATEPLTLPADAGFVIRFDPSRPQTGFRTPENEFWNHSFRYQGPWLSTSSMSLTSMKTIGIALFNNAPRRGGAAADFVASIDGTLRMTGSAGEATLAPGDYVEWSVRVFCFVENLPAVAIQDSYVGYLSGRNW